MFLQNFTKLQKNNTKIMLNTFSRCLIICEPAIETWAQEMNGGPGKDWGSRELNCSPTLEIIL